MRRTLFLFALLFALTFGSATAAGAQTAPPYGGTPPVDVGGDVVVPANPGGPGTPATPASPATEVRGDVVTRALAADASRGGLPVTGGDLVGLTVVGLGAVGVGTALVATRRRTLRTAA